MNFLYNSYLSWFQFILLAVILFLIFYFLRKYKTKILRLTGMHNLAIVNTLLAMLVVINFILVNPAFHLIIVLIGIFLGYSVLSDYIRGIIVASNSHLEIGDLIKVGEFKGKVASVNLSGIKMLNEQANLFVPYKKLSTETIEKFKSNQASFISIVCEPKEEIRGKLAISNLEKAVFDFPFIKNESTIEIHNEGPYFYINLTLANDRFRSSLYNQLDKAGFTIINKINSRR